MLPVSIAVFIAGLIVGLFVLVVAFLWEEQR